MIVLQQISDSSTIESWAVVPPKFTIPIGEVNGAGVGWESDGYRLVEVPNQVQVEDLTSVVVRLKRRVDLDAGRERLKYISPGEGIEMTYMEKHAQAQAVLILGDAAANALTEAERTAQFPTLAASVGTEAATLFACAQLVSQRYELYATASNGIEKARLSGKKAIADAVDAAAAEAAYRAITWP